MGKFTTIPENTFDNLQLDAGVLLTSFNPGNVKAPDDEDILCATTGGITATCIPTYSDLGEDVDNCPSNVMELKHLDSWECKLAFTSLGTNVDSIRTALGAADIGGNSVAPRRDLDEDDFEDSLWWVGDKADGGCVAVELKNALSTGGFSLQTTKSGKGQISCEITGHVSIEEQDVVPMVFYSLDGGTTADTDTEAEDTDTEADSDTETDTEADTEDTETEPETEEDTETEEETEEQVVLYLRDTSIDSSNAFFDECYIGKIVNVSEVTETDTVVGVYTTEEPESIAYYVFDNQDMAEAYGLDLADGEIYYATGSIAWLFSSCGYIIAED